MEPLILKFAEPALDEPNIDISLLEYDKDLQLSVLKNSRLPAFDFLNLGTQTFTKANAEPSDPDPISFISSLQTMTFTLNNAEVSDSDPENPKLHNALVTNTFTRAQIESTDRD